MPEELPILTELREALTRLLDGDAFSWQRIGGSYDLLRRALVEAVRGDHGHDPGPLVEDCWSLLRRPEAQAQVGRFHRLDPHYAGVSVDTEWLYRNACGLVATARTAVAAQHHDLDALLTWSRRAGELLGCAGGALTGALDAQPAPARELVDAAFRHLSEQGWRVQGARLWTLAWLPEDEPRETTSRRRGRGRRAGAMAQGATVCVPVAGCFDGNGFLADLCLRQLGGEGELLPHPETALQPLGTQLLGGLKAAWEPYGQSVCFTFGVHDAGVPSWVPLEGSSLSGAAALGFELLRRGKVSDACRLMVAHVGPEGTLEPVGHEVEKMEAALAGAVPAVVLAHNSQVPEVCIERFHQSGLEVVRARTLQEVLDLPTVKQPLAGGTRSRRTVPVVAAAALVLAAFGAQVLADRSRCPSRARVEIGAAGVWSDSEREAFKEVLEEFCIRSGIRVEYTKTADMRRELTGCSRPDVAMIAQPGLLKELARAGFLKPLDEAARRNLEENYTEEARAVGAVDGVLLGVYFKATNKSVWWYNVPLFKKADVEPPKRLEDLPELAQALRTRTGTPLLALGGEDGWPLTDLFENIYLATAGSVHYEELANGRLQWTHPTVIDALVILATLLDGSNLAGGTIGTLSATWQEAAKRMIQDPPEAATTFEGDFVVPVLLERPNVQPERDFDFFDFPSVGGARGGVIGGGDVAVALSDKPEAQRLLAFLATPEAARIWARRPGFATPNRRVAEGADRVSRRSASILASAGTGLQFDLSDQLPASFGASRNAGMWPILQDFLRNRNAPATATLLQDAAEKAKAQPELRKPSCP